MGYWISYAQLEVNQLPCQDVEALAEALVAATVSSDGVQDLCITDEFNEGWEDIINISCNKDGFSVVYDAEPGENPDTLSAFLGELSKSAAALFPTCEVSADYFAEYSAGDANLGVFTVQDGILSTAEDVMSDLWEEIKESDGEEDVDSGDGDDEEEDDTDWAEMEEECRDYLRSNLSVAAKYPDYSVSWDDEGTFHVISAAIHAGEVERVKTAAEKGIISRMQLKGALEASNSVPDAEVSAILLQLLQENNVGNMNQ